MPHLELSELELKTLWLMLERSDFSALPEGMRGAALETFGKVYRAYRGRPQEKTA
jgi:hypothetical protein